MTRKPLGPIDHKSIAGQFGNHLANLITTSGLTIPEFCKRLAKYGASRSETAVHNYIRGRSTPPMPDLGPMAKALGLASWQQMIPPAVAKKKTQLSKIR